MLYLNIVKLKKLNVEYFQSVNDPSFAGTMAVLTSGIHIPNPSELLGSHVFKDYINELKKSFDFIIIDCAPVGMISDAIPVGMPLTGLFLLFLHKILIKKMLQIV